jgi:hypothetical protein
VHFTAADVVISGSFLMTGSMLAGTASHTLDSLVTHLSVTSEAPDDEVASAIDQAERMCFVLNAITGQHTVQRGYTVNGSPRSAV